MCGGCFLQTIFSKILNVSVDQKTRPNIYFKTRGRAFQTLIWAFEAFRENQKLGLDLKYPTECLNIIVIKASYHRPMI